MLFEVFNHLLLVLSSPMIQRSLSMRFRRGRCTLKLMLEGNLFKICSEARVSHDTDLSIAGIAPLLAAIAKIGINTNVVIICAIFNAIC